MLARAGTPTNQQVEAASPESVAADEILLVQLATVLTDIKGMETQVWKLWREELIVMLPELSDVDSVDSPLSLEGNVAIVLVNVDVDLNCVQILCDILCPL